ncbi:MAG: hypothetical protein ACTSP9_03075 [Promethearchaeota archaeon]
MIRDIIIGIVQKSQGITYVGIINKLEVFSKAENKILPISNTQYHLLILSSNRIIKSVKHGKYRHYFTEEFSDSRMWILIFTQYAIPSKIITFLEGGLSASNQTLMEICKTTQETISYHTTRMVEKEVLVWEKQGRFKLFSLKKMKVE